MLRLAIIMTYYSHYVVHEPCGHPINADRMSFCEVVGAFIDILDVMELAYQKKILHRDINPSNMVYFGGHGYLVDWHEGNPSFMGFLFIFPIAAVIGSLRHASFMIMTAKFASIRVSNVKSALCAHNARTASRESVRTRPCGTT
jgi:serine/threonine protein kinase